MRRFNTALLVLSLLLLAPVVSAQPSASLPSDEALVAQVDAIVAKALQQPGTVGYSVAVARGDKVVLAKGYGLAELEHDVPANADTMFRIGSITKQFTAAAIMRLIEQGKLSLVDDITKLLPGYPTQGHTVTIHHLLNHTSGIKSYTDDDSFMQNNTGSEHTHVEMLALFKDEPFDFSPGEKWAYNNSGYYLLGMIIEEVSGKTYAQYVQDEFFTPLGLTRSRYDSSSEVIKNRAQGYHVVQGTLHNDRHMAMSIPGAAGALLCSAGDLVRWQIALMNHKVVNAESLTQMTTPAILPSGTNTQYGFGLMMTDYRGHETIGHGGGIFGFNSDMLYFPKEQLHIAVISNSQAARAASLLQHIANAALAIPEEEIKDLALTAEQLKRYLGNYQFQEIPLATNIFEHDGKLMAQATDQPAFQLLYQGNNEFRASFDKDVKVIFDAEGETAASFVLHQGGAKLSAIRK